MSNIQKNNLENSYFCEDMFRHLDDLEEAKEEVIKDFISVADGIIVVGNIDDNFVLDFADEINMEVKYIENAEQY